MSPHRLLAHALVTLVASLVSAGLAPAGAVAAESCTGPVTLLVDRSASMADHDPFGALRLAFADALQRVRPARDGDAVRPFDARLGAVIPAHPQGWPAAASAALAGGDRGATALGGVIDELPRGAGGVVVVTDAEAELGATGSWREALAGIVVVGGAAPAPLRSVAASAGVAVLGVGTAAAAEGAVSALCARPVDAARRDAVLVAGLRTTTGEVRGAATLASCRPAGPLATWCAALVDGGWRVWVPAMAPGGRGGARLNSTGRLTDNAAALRAWWHGRRAPHGAPPVLVGHSMGGLIAHAAIRQGLPAAALITVGTPHAGSYGADAYVAARAVAGACALRCPVLAAQLLGAAVAVRRRFGAALGDLTREQRTRIAPLGAPPVPLATWAGTTSSVPGLPSSMPIVGGSGGYVTPNDGIVGQGSATGALAGLHPDRGVSDGAARHSIAVPPKSAPTQLGSATVAAWVAASASGLGDDHGARLVAGRRPAARGATRRPRPALRRAAATLRTVGSLAPGAALQVPPEAVVVATTPMGLRCDGAEIPIVEASRGLWFVDLGTMGCRELRVESGALGAAWLLGEAARPAGTPPERVTITRRAPRRWRVEVRLAAAGRPTARRGRQRLVLAPVPPRTEWDAVRRWRGEVRGRGAGEVVVRVTTPAGAPRAGSVQLP